MLDKGPAPGGSEATAFREFWGDRAELRRFQVQPPAAASLHLLQGPCVAASQGPASPYTAKWVSDQKGSDTAAVAPSFAGHWDLSGDFGQ